jgi:hypothetical protein
LDLGSEPNKFAQCLLDNFVNKQWQEMLSSISRLIIVRPTRRSQISLDLDRLSQLTKNNCKIKLALWRKVKFNWNYFEIIGWREKLRAPPSQLYLECSNNKLTLPFVGQV